MRIYDEREERVDSGWIEECQCPECSKNTAKHPNCRNVAWEIVVPGISRRRLCLVCGCRGRIVPLPVATPAA